MSNLNKVYTVFIQKTSGITTYQREDEAKIVIDPERCFQDVLHTIYKEIPNPLEIQVEDNPNLTREEKRCWEEKFKMKAVQKFKWSHEENSVVMLVLSSGLDDLFWTCIRDREIPTKTAFETVKQLDLEFKARRDFIDKTWTEYLFLEGIDRKYPDLTLSYPFNDMQKLAENIVMNGLFSYAAKTPFSRNVIRAYEMRRLDPEDSSDFAEYAVLRKCGYGDYLCLEPKKMASSASVTWNSLLQSWFQRNLELPFGK